jgi:hypothetical protein
MVFVVVFVLAGLATLDDFEYPVLLEHLPSEVRTTMRVLGYSRELWAILEVWHDRGHDRGRGLDEGHLAASTSGIVVPGEGASDLS